METWDCATMTFGPPQPGTPHRHSSNHSLSRRALSVMKQANSDSPTRHAASDRVEAYSCHLVNPGRDVHFHKDNMGQMQCVSVCNNAWTETRRRGNAMATTEKKQWQTRSGIAPNSALPLGRQQYATMTCNEM